MRASAEAIRKLFIARHGEATFELVAKLFAEVGGDSAAVDLSSVHAWRSFAESLKVVPRSEILQKAFLWCVLHRMPLEKIDRPTVPAAIELIEDSDVIRQIFELFPYFIANSEQGLRCLTCFDEARSLIDVFTKMEHRVDIQLLLSRISDSQQSHAANDRP